MAWDDTWGESWGESWESEGGGAAVASAWGTSWGGSWGDSWGVYDAEPRPGCVHIESEVVTNVLINSRNVYHVGISDMPATEVQITSETC
jgi:hypothetical protein